MPNLIRIEVDISMEMRDGTILRADFTRPDDNGKHPAILIRTPYNKQALRSGGFMNPIDAALAGFAVVHQDIRGRYSSEGEWRGALRFAAEGPDGYDSVEWIASQPWCDGNVGMAGSSYQGALAVVTAVENPPHLKAIAPWVTVSGTSSWEPVISGGAVLKLQFATGWIPWAAFDVVDRLEKQGKDVSKMREMLNRVRSNPEELYSYLPLKDAPHFQFEGVKEIWEDELSRDVPGPESEKEAFWPYHTITVPCFYTSGWYDYYIWGTLQNFVNMREKGGSEIARQGQYVLMGPWKHGGSPLHSVGAINFGSEASAGNARVSQQNIDFFNKYLRGMDIKIPAVRYFVMGMNVWKEGDVWPLSQTKWQRFFLHSKGHANTADGDGLLGQDEPSLEPTDVYVYNPFSPVPTFGTRFSPMTIGMAGPMEQALIEKRNDVLCYTTPELEEDIEVTGPLELHLFASTSAKDTDFTAKLVDVYPEGQAYNIADGIIRARYRKSGFHPELVKPGEIYEYIINLASTSNLFRKGHRIRIDVSSSNFPVFNRNMNTGNPVGEDIEGIPAMQIIYHQQRYASYIDLPVIPIQSR